MSINHKKTTLSRAGFTLVEMMVVVPIAMILIAVLVYALIQMANSATASNERTVRMTSLLKALDIIEQDVSVANQFLVKPRLRDYDDNFNDGFLNYGDNSNPQLTESVRCGIYPRSVNSSGNCKDDANQQPRLIVNRLATITSPDTDKTAKVLAHFKNGGFPTQCKHNPPVLFNAVYFIDKGNLYRRNILPRTKKSGAGSGAQVKYDPDKLFCKWSENKGGSSSVTYHEPWHQPTCSSDSLKNPSASEYCRGQDLLLLKDAEIDIQYFTEGGMPINKDLIYNNSSGEIGSQSALNTAIGVKIILKSKVSVTKSKATQEVVGEVVINKLSDSPVS